MQPALLPHVLLCPSCATSCVQGGLGLGEGREGSQRGLPTRAHTTLLYRNVTKDRVQVIAHRLSTVSNADEVAVVSDGVIAERAPHAELLAAGMLASVPCIASLSCHLSNAPGLSCSAPAL